MSARARFLPLFVSLLLLAAPACREKGDIEIAKLTFHGVKGVNETQLRDVLATKQGSRLPWGRKRQFDRAAFEADLKRVQAFYRDRGYPDARVSSFDVKLDKAQRKVAITVDISEGEPLRLDAIYLDGFDVLQRRQHLALQHNMPLQPGDPLDRQLVVAARERAVNALRDHGYAYAEVGLREESTGSHATRIILTATPGPLTYFGPVEVRGEASVSENIVQRELTYKPGDLFRRNALTDSQRRLYDLQLFQFANIEPLGAATQEIFVPTRVTVAEGKHRNLTAGVGYGTEEKARVRLRWEHVNFFGGARNAGVEGKWSSLDRGVRADFRQPYFLRQHFSLGFDGQAWQTAENAYSANTVGGRMTLTHRGDPILSWSASLEEEYQRSRISRLALADLSLRNQLIDLGLDPRNGQQDGRLTALAFDVQRNTTRNLLDARRGSVLSAHAEQAGAWLPGTFSYYLLSAEARHYQSIAKRFVIANKVRMGTIDGLGKEPIVPFSKRLFLGGAASLRGWGRYEVSPLSGSGLPIGGLTMLEGSSELRVPAWGNLGLVVFLDAGNVWSGRWAFTTKDLRYDAGPGFRYLTPVGPIRFDVGYQLNPIPGLLVNGLPQTRRWRMHFSIGQAF